jgi:type IV pilus assembly protein PilA
MTTPRAPRGDTAGPLPFGDVMTRTTNIARRRSALTLAELVAVLAATGVIAALAYSAYRTHTVRKEVGAGLARANELIPGVTEFFRRHGAVPATLEPPAAHRADVSPLVASATIVDGRIDIVYGEQADPSIAGRRISLTPYETVQGHVVWLCGNETPDVGLQPLGFAGGGRQTVLAPTTIEPHYLPRACR